MSRRRGSYAQLGFSLVLLAAVLSGTACTDQTSLGGACGDGVVDVDEVCDGTNFQGTTCQILGFSGGTLGCASDCSGFDTSQCTSLSVCGDGLAEGIEACDGIDFRGATCQTEGFEAGRLACNPGCASLDLSGCSSTTPPPPSCGNGLAEGSEACDGTDLLGQTCISQGFNRGELSCSTDCATFDFSRCLNGNPRCGDDIAEGGEACDGADLHGETCETQGFQGGTLSCVASCLRFVTDQCTSGEVCGDGAAEGVELCDGDDLGGETCQSQGFTGGTLACAAGCGFDTGACTNFPVVCGNDIAEGAEVCDGTDLMGNDCKTVPGGFTGGTLACSTYCGAFVTTGCATSATAPAGWVCDPLYFGDGDCDCGCGALDIDCNGSTDAACDFDSCPAGETVDPAQNWLCTGGSSTGWICDITWFGDGDCDCGCGVIDADCTGSTDAACFFDNCPAGETVDPAQNWLCVGVSSAGWTCDLTWFGDGDCDCGCGTLDADCSDGSDTACTYTSCPTGEVPDATQNWLCVGGSASNWTCDLTWFGDGSCDCGCGELDSDCLDGSDASCLYNNCPTGEVPDASQNWVCVGGSGGTWTCDPTYYGDGDCDCGCGELDIDCADATSASCLYDACPTGETPDANQNWLCVGGSGGGWTCTASYYGDGDCDCGCGVLDSDCGSSSDTACIYEWCAGSLVVDSSQNWLCI